MAQEFSKAFYDSTAWRSCREAYRKSVGGLCELCLAKGMIRAADVVHHKILLTPENIKRPEITMNFDNLEALCHACHAERHPEEHRKVNEKLRKRSKKRWIVGQDGRIVLPLTDKR